MCLCLSISLTLKMFVDTISVSLSLSFFLSNERKNLAVSLSLWMNNTSYRLTKIVENYPVIPCSASNPPIAFFATSDDKSSGFSHVSSVSLKPAQRTKYSLRPASGYAIPMMVSTSGSAFSSAFAFFFGWCSGPTGMCSHCPFSFLT